MLPARSKTVFYIFMQKDLATHPELLCPKAEVAFYLYITQRPITVCFSYK